jgi:hypothetical protein
LFHKFGKHCRRPAIQRAVRPAMVIVIAPLSQLLPRVG